MPGLINREAIQKHFQEIRSLLEKNQESAAMSKLQLFLDAMNAIDAYDNGGNPEKIPEITYQFYTEIRGFDENDADVQEDLIKRPKISLQNIFKDTQSVVRFMELNQISQAKELLQKMIERLSTSGGYPDPGTQGDLIIKARNDIRKASKTFLVNYIEVGEAEKLIEKYIEESYQQGKTERDRT